MYNGFNFTAFFLVCGVMLLASTCGLIYHMDRQKGFSEVQSFRDAIIPIEMIGAVFIVIYVMEQL